MDREPGQFDPPPPAPATEPVSPVESEPESPERAASTPEPEPEPEREPGPFAPPPDWLEPLEQALAELAPEPEPEQEPEPEPEPELEPDDREQLELLDLEIEQFDAPSASPGLSLTEAPPPPSPEPEFEWNAPPPPLPAAPEPPVPPEPALVPEPVPARPSGSRREWLILIVAGALVFGAGLSVLVRSCAKKPTGPAGPHKASTREEVQRLLDAGPLALGLVDTTGAESTWVWVRAFYEQRGGRPAWSGHDPHRKTADFVTTLQRIGDAGLEPRDYGTDELVRLLAQTRSGSLAARFNREKNLARLDVRATYAALRVAPHLREGRLPRGVLDPDWTPRFRVDWLAYLKARIERDPAKALAALEPRHEGYRRLRQALDHYRGIAAAGGWPEIPPGPPLQDGDRGPRVATLIRRLDMTGDLLGPVRDTVYDRRMVHTIGEYQARQGIPRSGIVGEATRLILNVPVEARIRQMELNLERWRWLPDDLGERRVEVNIPAYRLELIDRGSVARAMRVVVGKKGKSPTPVFSDVLAYVDVNPTWTLPPSVVQKEIVPTLKRDPGYLAANKMHVVSIADARRDTVDPAEVPWKDAESDSFLYLIIQEAGPDNPLGRVKIMCPNEYDVYLHDSPQRHRFGVAVRDYSHGCVRVEEAVELADSLLRVLPGDSLFVDSLVTRSEWKRARLPQPVPVHFLYWTAWADVAGRMYFRDDIYGLDDRLSRAIHGGGRDTFVVNPGVAISPFWLAAEKRAREVAGKFGPKRRR